MCMYLKIWGMRLTKFYKKINIYDHCKCRWSGIVEPTLKPQNKTQLPFLSAKSGGSWGTLWWRRRLYTHLVCHSQPHGVRICVDIASLRWELPHTRHECLPHTKVGDCTNISYIRKHSRTDTYMLYKIQGLRFSLQMKNYYKFKLQVDLKYLTVECLG